MVIVALINIHVSFFITRRLYQFIGNIPTSTEPPMFQHIFAAYEDKPGTNQNILVSIRWKIYVIDNDNI